MTSMTSMKRILAMGLVLGPSASCADPCDDDGLGQQQCDAVADASDTDEGSASADDSASMSDSVTAGSMTAGSMSADGTNTADDTATADTGDTGMITVTVTATETESASATDTESASATDTESASATDTESASATDTESATSDDASASATDATSGTTGEPGLWCVDADGDGFGNPELCMPSDEPVPGSVENDDDCDDGNPDAFPGAAQNEADPTLCTIDLDGDGFADGSPPPGITPGTDCWDVNPLLNPSTVVLATVANALVNDEVQSIDLQTAALETMAPLDTLLVGFDIITTAMTNAGTIYGNNAADLTLYEIDYQLVCVGQITLGEVTPLPNPHGITGMCGISFGPGGALYGLDSATDTLVVLDLATGLAAPGVPLTQGGEPLDVASCGLAWDCVQERLVLANGLDGNVYQIDADTGAVTLLADTELVSDPTGLEHDPATNTVYLASDTELSRVHLDGTSTVEPIGTFDAGLGEASSVSNLAFMPACDP